MSIVTSHVPSLHNNFVFGHNLDTHPHPLTDHAQSRHHTYYVCIMCVLVFRKLAGRYSRRQRSGRSGAGPANADQQTQPCPGQADWNLLYQDHYGLPPSPRSMSISGPFLGVSGFTLCACVVFGRTALTLTRAVRADTFRAPDIRRGIRLRPMSGKTHRPSAEQSGPAIPGAAP
jgi:hypothetical protein